MILEPCSDYAACSNGAPSDCKKLLCNKKTSQHTEKKKKDHRTLQNIESHSTNNYQKLSFPTTLTSFVLINFDNASPPGIELVHCERYLSLGEKAK